jgi:hypothetical protein
MQTANEYGVFQAENVEELARRGRSYVAIELCQCADGLHRYALDISYSYGGFGGPISDHCEGFSTSRAAIDAATRELLRRFPQACAGDPQSVHDELRDLKAQIEKRFRQPSLF